MVIVDVPFSICSNSTSTTNPAMDAKSIALERSESPHSNDVLDIVELLLQQKLSGFEKVALWLDFDYELYYS
jgi:hypothetical protein